MAAKADVARGVTATRGIVPLIGAHPYTALVLALGLLLRAALLPLGFGEDFRVWDLASRYTLAGVNVYAHHPPYPGGPYAYFPLFLYVELPFQWMALHGGVSFTVLGKLPIVAGDALTAGLLAAVLARRGCRDAIVALGTALYVLNPLVLYNGAFYGRFDTLCAGLLLLALVVHDRKGAACALTPDGATDAGWQPALPVGTDAAGQRERAAALPVGTGGRVTPARRDVSHTLARPWLFPLIYAAAVAMKSYPVFLLPWLLSQEPANRKRLLLALVGVLGGLSLPYALTSPVRFFADIALYDAHKTPGHLSWQTLILNVLSPHAARLLSYLLLALFVAALVHYRRLDLWTYSLVSILLFILLSKVVIEQYFLWPLPLLILDAIERRSWASGYLLALISAVGMLVNPYIHPFGESPWPLNLILAASITLYVYARTAPRNNIATRHIGTAFAHDAL